MAIHEPEAMLKDVEFVITDLVKKLEDQKAEGDRQLKVLSRQIKVRRAALIG